MGHASNVFGFALLSLFILKQRAYTWSIFVWALVVSFTHLPWCALSLIYWAEWFLNGCRLIVYAIPRGFQTKLKAGIKSQLIDSSG